MGPARSDTRGNPDRAESMPVECVAMQTSRRNEKRPPITPTIARTKSAPAAARVDRQRIDGSPEPPSSQVPRAEAAEGPWPGPRLAAQPPAGCRPDAALDDEMSKPIQW